MERKDRLVERIHRVLRVVEVVVCPYEGQIFAVLRLGTPLNGLRSGLYVEHMLAPSVSILSDTIDRHDGLALQQNI